MPLRLFARLMYSSRQATKLSHTKHSLVRSVGKRLDLNNQNTIDVTCAAMPGMLARTYDCTISCDGCAPCLQQDIAQVTHQMRHIMPFLITPAASIAAVAPPSRGMKRSNGMRRSTN